MFQKMLASALIAGFAAGLVAAALQLAFVQPVLLHAELYESGDLVHIAGAGAEGHAYASGGHADDGHSHAAESGGDLARNGLSALFSALIYVGYGLLLVVGFALAARYGIPVTARDGLLWGIAGFVAVQLAPSAGLAPELPGSAAADLTARQLWWFGTVIATAAGLALIAFGGNWGHWGLAAALILAPHAIGAPQPAAMAGTAPPELAAEFAGRALAVGLAGWALLGLFAGHFWSRERLV